MAFPRRAWLNSLAALFGGLMVGSGAVRLFVQPTLGAALWAVLGFLVLGGAVLDARRYRRGTPESEVDGGHTIE